MIEEKREELISIIVPVYNTQEYLPKCIKSLISQTYQNLEIILIDDGSTDDSGEICDEWAKKDDRIQVIHKQNEGVSATKNKGIEIAKGAYIGFVDSDDFIEETMYEVLYDNLIKFDVDISMCNYYIEKKGKKTFHKHDLKDGLLINTQKEFFELLRLNYYRGFLCNKLFKAEMIKTLKLDEKIYVCEDMLLISQIALKCKRFYFDNACYYNYVMRENSATLGKINDKKLTALDAYRKIIRIVEEYGDDLVMKYEWDFWRWENDFIRKAAKENQELKKENQLLYRKILKSKYIKLNEKMILFIRFRLYGIYDFMRKLYHKIK